MNWLKPWQQKREQATPPPAQSQPAEIAWIPADKNPWSVPLLDVRPITLHMLSTTKDPQCAINSNSFICDDGTGFIGITPSSTRIINPGLRFHIDRILADGALFIPRQMEHKWAIYQLHGKILFIRSWLRQPVAVAEIKTESNWAEILTLQGTLTADDEDPAFTIRVLDYLLHTHALELSFPVPLPHGMEKDPHKAAMWCFHHFGNLANYATPYLFPSTIPEEPLRTISHLHMAAASGGVERAAALMGSRMPADLPGKDTLTPLHWSLMRDDMSMLMFFLSRGISIDTRSSEGATPLMLVVQERNLTKANFLLDHGADVNATDLRGFTALHRAAELGELTIVRLLLGRGAIRQPEAQGHTPGSLAQKGGHRNIVELLAE